MSNIAYLPRRHYAGPVLTDPGSDMPKLPSQLDVIAASRQIEDAPTDTPAAAPILVLMVGGALAAAVGFMWLAA